MLLFPVSVKAETIISFAIPDNGWTWGNQTNDCAGNFNDKNVVDQGAFVWSGGHYEAVQRYDDTWTGANSGSKCCTKDPVSFSAATYTITLITKRKDDNVTMTLPTITIQQGTPSTHYAAKASWDNGSGLQEETISSNQFRYTVEDGKNSRDREVTLTYNNVVINAAGNYRISIDFPSGDKDKYLMKTLTITQNCTQYTVTVAADDNNKGTVAGGGSYCENSEVTVTATPKPGYNFVNWTDNNNSNAVVSTNASHTFTLIANVSYRANFAACEGAAVTVNVNNGDMGSATGAGSYCPGDQVDIEATPNSGYRFVNWTVTSGSASLDNVNNVSTHFTMSNPAAAVTVQANFEVDPCTNSKTIQCESNYVVVTVHGNADEAATPDVQDGYVQTVDENHWYAYYYPVTISSDLSSFNFNVRLARSSNDNSYINVFKKTNEGSGNVEYAGAYYNKLGWKKLATGDWNDNWFTVDVASFDDGGSGFSTLSAGEYLVALSGRYRVKLDYFTLTASENIFCPNTITMAKSEGGSANPTATVEEVSVTTAFEGATVTVTAAAASAGYNFSGWTASPEVTFADASATSTTFTMPANAVTITANYVASVSSALTFAAGEGGSITSATAGGNTISSDDNVASGTSVTLTAEANSNYVFINWTDNNNSDAVVSTNAAFTFSMPATATAYTANFAQIDNVISQGSETGSDKGNSGGGASIAESHIADFDAFGHNVVKLTYSGMSGSSAYCGWNIGKSDSYNSASSAGATGFGFYYKTEAADDAVAMWFDPNTGNDADQRGMQLAATENVWKYVYIEHAVANSWNHDNIIIYINGEQESKTTANPSGAIYIADIAATSITSKPDIAAYHYTYNRGGAMQVNDYGTLCLPMGGTIEGATLYSVAGKEESDKTYIVLEDKGTSVEAGKPYITQSTATSYTVTMSGAHSVVQAGNGLMGTYTEENLTPYDETHHNYFLYENAFKKAGTDVTVGAYRAYLNLDAVGAVTPAPGARRIRMVIEGTNSATGLEDLDLINDQLPVTSKVLIDGQLFIIREGKRYTLTGARAQ